MEDSLSSNASDTANSKGIETMKERPASLDLESSNLGKEEELNLDDTKPTTRWPVQINFSNACGLNV